MILVSPISELPILNEWRCTPRQPYNVIKDP